MTFSDDVATRTLWQEARGEPDEGIIAVAHVLLNRLRDGRWGISLSEVCLWRDQFSGWRSSDPNFAPACRLDPADMQYQRCFNLFQEASNVPDPTNGALFYFSDALAIPPTWAVSMIETAQIGRHRFFTDKPA